VRDGRRLHRVRAGALAVVVLGVDQRRGLRLLLEAAAGTQRIVLLGERVRSYAMQPPTIPHKTDNYQVDRFANKCMTCHARTRVGETQATPISITHYQDRDGNFLADVSPRRYFCEQCHVVQMDGVQPAVKNRFRDVETMIRKNKK